MGTRLTAWLRKPALSFLPRTHRAGHGLWRGGPSRAGSPRAYWARAIVGLAAVALVAGCSKSDSDAGGATAKAAPSAAATEPVEEATAGEPTAEAIAKACQGAETKGPLAWFSDDYGAALACAQASRRPLLIDLWAKWCHTCLSMKHTVLLDKSLQPFSDRFVWLELDTDKEINAAALAKFPPQVWPTFYILAPRDESVQARYLGAASIGQFRALLSEGEKAVLATQTGDLPASSPLRFIRDGDRAMAQSEWTAARTSYGQALAALPKDSTRRPDVSVSMISAFYKGGDFPGCFALAQREMAHTGKSASAADFIYYGALCASGLAESESAATGTSPDSATPDSAAIAAFRNAAVARLSTLIDDESAPLSIDDRGEAMRIAREIKGSLGDSDGARALAERQRKLLDDAAGNAPGPFAAMTFNWPRAEVYAYLDIAKELIPDLEKSIADLPTEYDPPYRLAWIHLQIGEHDKALAMVEKALSLGYGPRKAHIQKLLAAIHHERGDLEAERAARQGVVALYKALPEGQKQPNAQAQAEAALAALVEKPPAKKPAAKK